MSDVRKGIASYGSGPSWSQEKPSPCHAIERRVKDCVCTSRYWLPVGRLRAEDHASMGNGCRRLEMVSWPQLLVGRCLADET